MTRVKDLLDKRYQIKTRKMSAIVESLPRDNNGKSLGYVLCTIGSQSNVKVYTGINEVYYPGDYLSVEQRGSAVTAKYIVESFHGGIRPNSGVYEFGESASLTQSVAGSLFTTQEFEVGDIVFGDPTGPNWFFDYDTALMYLRSGSYINGNISSSATITLGPSTGKHQYLSSSGIQFKDSASVLAGLNASSFFIGASNGAMGMSYNSGSLIINGNIYAQSGSFSGVLQAQSGSISGSLMLGTNGGIYQGTGTFTSPSTGLKIWNDSGIGKIAGYNSATSQWGAGTDGKLYAGGGSLIIDSNGILFAQGGSAYNKIKWGDGTDYAAEIYSSVVVGDAILRLNISSSNKLIENMPTHIQLNAEQSINGASITLQSGSYAQLVLASNSDSGSINLTASTIKLTGDISSASGNINYTGSLIANRGGTNYTGYMFIPLLSPCSHTSYMVAAGSVATGTYYINPSVCPAIAGSIKALAVRMAGRWDTANNTYTAALRPRGAGVGAAVNIRPYAASVYSDSGGIVPTDSASNQIELVIGGCAISNIQIEIWGYFI